jgi:hypothetical protein
MSTKVREGRHDSVVRFGKSKLSEIGVAIVVSHVDEVILVCGIMTNEILLFGPLSSDLGERNKSPCGDVGVETESG